MQHYDPHIFTRVRTVDQAKAIILTPDKDLGQCVRGTRVVQYDRRKDEIIDEAGVVAKFGIGPASIPDYLGLVGDSADGFPGLPGWGSKGASTVLARHAPVADRRWWPGTSPSRSHSPRWASSNSSTDEVPGPEPRMLRSRPPTGGPPSRR